jgi:hypothetical protein
VRAVHQATVGHPLRLRHGPSGKMALRSKVRRLPDAANRERGKSRFFTRSGLNWLSKFSFIQPGLEKLPRDIIIDGEVVSVEPNGRSNFSQLQDDIKRGRPDRMTFYAFDLLYLGVRLRTAPLRALSPFGLLTAIGGLLKLDDRAAHQCISSRGGLTFGRSSGQRVSTRW